MNEGSIVSPWESEAAFCGVDGPFEGAARAASAWKANPRCRTLKDWGDFGSTTALSKFAGNCCPAVGTLMERGADSFDQPLAAQRNDHHEGREGHEERRFLRGACQGVEN